MSSLAQSREERLNWGSRRAGCSTRSNQLETNDVVERTGVALRSIPRIVSKCITWEIPGVSLHVVYKSRSNSELRSNEFSVVVMSLTCVLIRSMQSCINVWFDGEDSSARSCDHRSTSDIALRTLRRGVVRWGGGSTSCMDAHPLYYYGNTCYRYLPIVVTVPSHHLQSTSAAASSSKAVKITWWKGASGVSLESLLLFKCAFHLKCDGWLMEYLDNLRSDNHVCNYRRSH